MATIFKVLSTGLKVLGFLTKSWKNSLDLLFIKAGIWGYLIFSFLGLYIFSLSKIKAAFILLSSIFLMSFFYLNELIS